MFLYWSSESSTSFWKSCRLNVMDEHKNWIKLALDEARKSGQDVPIGCVIVKDGRIIARGYNQREALQDPTAHAEMVAIRAAASQLGSWRLQDCQLYCTLEPCPMCAETILQSRLGTLVFGAYDMVYGAAGSAFNLFSRRTFPSPEIIGGIEEEDCRLLIQDFFQKIRAKQRSSS